jgi:hypothetical protein
MCVLFRLKSDKNKQGGGSSLQALPAQPAEYLPESVTLFIRKSRVFSIIKNSITSTNFLQHEIRVHTSKSVLPMTLCFPGCNTTHRACLMMHPLLKLHAVRRMINWKGSERKLSCSNSATTPYPTVSDARSYKPLLSTYQAKRCHNPESHNVNTLKQNYTPWPQSASKLYRPSNRRLSAKLVPTFAETQVSCSQRGGSPTAVISGF